MPSAANITLADAQATPVNHTFVPLGPDKEGVFWWEDQSQASPIGYWKLSAELKRPPAGMQGTKSVARTFRVRLGLHEPILENVTNSTVSGIAPAPTISYVPRGFIEYVLPERSALIDRKNMRKMLGLFNSDAQVVSIVEDLQFVY